MICFFFFFKQKTAYDMRISDWSSDVCSSDLVIRCARCGIDVVTKGIGQKYCEPCYPDAAKERDRRHDRQRHIRNGRVVVGPVINCRTCLKEFEKVGIHQIYCSQKCRQKRRSSDPQWTINRRMRDRKSVE